MMEMHYNYYYYYNFAYYHPRI